MRANQKKVTSPKSMAAADALQKKDVDPTSSFEDLRPDALAASDLSQSIAASDTVQAKPNDTGLPDDLKSGIEDLSGHSMDDVKVHYNSSKPSQLNAHAYAQGTQIHLAPGQNQHLPHEAWHVAQQKQGRVRPTTEVNGAAVNDDVGLETEADVMGTKALQLKPNANFAPLSSNVNTTQPVAQRVLWYWISGSWVNYEDSTNPPPTHEGTHYGEEFNDAQEESVSDHESDEDGKEEEIDTSVRNPAYRPQEGGMSETEAAIIADENDWDDVSKEWRCSDRAHTPKGKVYKQGSNYYGADNTGHVGWGFKVWTKKNHTTLDYAGNLVWDGTGWKHIARGT